MNKSLDRLGLVLCQSCKLTLRLQFGELVMSITDPKWDHKICDPENSHLCRLTFWLLQKPGTQRYLERSLQLLLSPPGRGVGSWSSFATLQSSLPGLRQAPAYVSLRTMKSQPLLGVRISYASNEPLRNALGRDRLLRQYNPRRGYFQSTFVGNNCVEIHNLTGLGEISRAIACIPVFKLESHLTHLSTPRPSGINPDFGDLFLMHVLSLYSQLCFSQHIPLSRL